MKIPRAIIDDFICEVALENFGTSTFGRKSLIEAVIEKAKQLGLWTEDDETPTKGARKGSKGFSDIDLAISFPTKPGLLIKSGRNQWRVSTKRNFVEQLAVDTVEPPGRTGATISRVIRDTIITKALKQIYEFKCQICGVSLRLGEGKEYAEVHHIRPLGGEHRGLDTPGNMLVLCPNHHAQFDFGAPKFSSESKVIISGNEYEMRVKHELFIENIDYYNNKIYLKPGSKGT